MATHGFYLGVLAAVGSAAAWATGAVLFKRLGGVLDPLGMTFAKALVSVALLGTATAVGQLALPGGAAFWWLCLSGAIGIGIGDSCFFAALRRLSPQALTVLMLAGPSLLSGVVGALFLREQPTAAGWGGLGLAAVGLVVMIYPTTPDPTAARTTGSGLFWGILSLGCTVGSMAIARPALQEVSTVAATLVRMSAGAGVVLLAGVCCGRIRAWPQPFLSGSYRFKFIGATTVVTIGGFWLALGAVKHLELALASNPFLEEAETPADTQAAGPHGANASATQAAPDGGAASRS